ncbi:MAG: hypothetical protein Q7J31_04290 [Syntrophales bacterium]|nr:hypothetical protein [Syntrophales bacterium]
MSKFKKNKSKGEDNPKLLTTEVLEQKAQSDLDRQNYRRAKEWLKELCKRNKSHYLPQLTACYNGLAKQMLEKGQTVDAKNIFDHIRFLAGDKVDPHAEAQLATRSENYSAAAEIMIRRYGDGNKPLTTEDGRVIADTLVIAFEDVPRLQEKHPELYKELTAVRRALEYVCTERFTDALGELKHIRLQSVFAGWRLFVKGLCAFYAGEHSKAREAFQRLANESLLSRAARPFILIIDKNTRMTSKDEVKEPLLIQTCQILNRSDMAPVLPRAEYLWRLRRYADSYAHVAQALKGFPSEEPGLLRILSLFYFNAIFHMDSRQADKYLTGIHDVLRKKNNASMDFLFFTRARNLYFDHNPEVRDHEYLKLWEEFLIFHHRVHEENGKLRALVYAHLGDIFATEEESGPFAFIFERKKQKAGVRNFKMAEEAYEKSLQFNGHDKDVHLKMLRLYEVAGEHSKRKRNKKLDEIIRLFPDDKDSLAKNGNFCIERKAFIKGIEFLKRAAALDPLDRNNRESLCVAYIKASLHFAKEGNTRRYREFMRDAIAMGEPGLENMNLGRPYLQARLAIFEWIGGCEEEGNRLLADVIGNGNDDVRLLYFAYLVGRTYGVTELHLSQLQKHIKPIFQNPTPGAAAALTDVIKYVNHVGLPKPWLDDEFHHLNRYALEAVDKPCTPAEAEKIVRYAFEQEREGKILVQRYVKKMLAQDPRQPLFLYFKYLSDRSNLFRPPTKNDLQILQDILDIAVERNERLLINIFTKELRKIEEVLSRESRFDDEEDSEEATDFGKIFDETVKKFNAVKNSSSQRKRIRPDMHQASLFDDLN